MFLPLPSQIRAIRNLLRGKLSIALYMDEGAWTPGVAMIKEILFLKGLPHREVWAEDVNTSLDGFDGICFPGGWAVPYTTKVTDQGIENIRNLIANGGKYFGVCAGSWYTADRILWRGETYEYPLDLYKGVAWDIDQEIIPYPEQKLVWVDIDLGPIFSGLKPIRVKELWLYWGGPSWYEDELKANNAKVLGRFSDYDNKPAVMAFEYGKGRVLLCSPHPELSKNLSILPMFDWLYQP
jgi:glutamine amidotransferase PdxT